MDPHPRRNNDYSEETLLLTDIYTYELLSWLPKDTCGNVLMILGHILVIY